MKKVYLGIDGGGTKTDFLLCDSDLREIARVTKSGCNPNDIGIDKCLEILCDGISNVMQGNEDNKDEEIFLFAGLSGGATGDNQALISNGLKQKFPHLKISCGSDAQNAVEIGLGENDGIAVICGTGSILYAKIISDLHRVAGFGYIFGDECSGYAFGRAAIHSALRADNNLCDKSFMSEAVNARLGKGALAALGDIYQGGKKYIASFADIVFQARENGDAEAIQIVNENVDWLTKMIVLTEKKYNVPKNVALIGGVFKHQPFLIDELQSKLGDYKIKFASDAPVIGAVRLARRIDRNGK